MERPQSSFRFPRRERLSRRRDFQVLLRRGKVFEAYGIRFRYLRNGLPFSRLGLAVSRRRGKAAQRNRIRRLFREGYRLARHNFPYPVDVVAIPRRGHDVTFERSCRAFEALSEALGRVREEKR